MDAGLRALEYLGETPSSDNPYRALQETLRRGIRKQSADRLMTLFPVKSRPAWSTRLRDLQPEVLAPEDGARTARLAYVLGLAVSVWGGRAPAVRFLTRPHPALGDATPLEAATDEWGAREVEKILLNIRYGLPA